MIDVKELNRRLPREFLEFEESASNDIRGMKLVVLNLKQYLNLAQNRVAEGFKNVETLTKEVEDLKTKLYFEEVGYANLNGAKLKVFTRKQNNNLEALKETNKKEVDSLKAKIERQRKNLNGLQKRYEDCKKENTEIKATKMVKEFSSFFAERAIIAIFDSEEKPKEKENSAIKELKRISEECSSNTNCSSCSIFDKDRGRCLIYSTLPSEWRF